MDRTEYGGERAVQSPTKCSEDPQPLQLGRKPLEARGKTVRESRALHQQPTVPPPSLEAPQGWWWRWHLTRVLLPKEG